MSDSKTPLYYLAQPYSSPHKELMAARAHDAVMIASTFQLMYGINIFSPIAYSIPLSEQITGTDWETWKRLDTRMLLACSHLIDMRLPGYEHSVGRRAEVMTAITNGIPVYRLEVKTGERFANLDPEIAMIVFGDQYHEDGRFELLGPIKSW